MYPLRDPRGQEMRLPEFLSVYTRRVYTPRPHSRVAVRIRICTYVLCHPRDFVLEVETQLD